MTGSSGVYGWNGRKPYHSINFVTVHDGFTMYDLFSYTEKQNDCGLLNPICCDDPFSAWCDTDSGEEHNRSYDWNGREHMKRQQMRNLFAAMMFSHGTPMILGGDEWMRTQYGNNNAYSTWSDNECIEGRQPMWYNWSPNIHTSMGIPMNLYVGHYEQQYVGCWGSLGCHSVMPAARANGILSSPKSQAVLFT